MQWPQVRVTSEITLVFQGLGHFPDALASPDPAAQESARAAGQLC